MGPFASPVDRMSELDPLDPNMKILGSRHDICLGTAEPALAGLPKFWLTPEDQAHHATIWGRTGSGKSYLLLNLFLQHLNKGHGVGLIDPHGDLSLDILSYLTNRGFFRDSRGFRKLVYIDWGSRAVTPFNVLLRSETARDADDLIDDQAHSLALNILDVAYRVWPELRTGAPLFKQLYVSAVMALIAAELPLSFLADVLENQAFRSACLSKVDDSRIITTWRNFEKLPVKDQLMEAGSTMRRAWDLTFHPILRHALGSPDKVARHREWMDSSTCVIHNLGRIKDRLTRQILGALLLVDIEQAALSRADTPFAKRIPFTLLVDEWGMFAAQEDTIAHVLSETRKYGLRLYLAAQSLSQVGSARLAGALENCKLNVALGLGPDSAEAQARYLADFDPSLVKEEAGSATQHALYASVFEQREAWVTELRNLDTRLGYVKLANRPAVKIKTLAIGDLQAKAEALDQVLSTYRALYQRSQQEAERLAAMIQQPTASVNANNQPNTDSIFAWSSGQSGDEDE